MRKRGIGRRAFFAAALALPAGGCSPDDFQNLFSRHKYTLTSRGDRMVRWLQNDGHDVMMAPEALAVMGFNNSGRDILVRQLAEDGRDGRYVISLVNLRQIHEFILHRRQGDVLIFHHCDTAFRRLTSVRYPRNGKPTFITDTAFADNDFEQQLTFWFDRMPGR